MIAKWFKKFKLFFLKVEDFLKEVGGTARPLILSFPLSFYHS